MGKATLTIVPSMPVTSRPRHSTARTAHRLPPVMGAVWFIARRRGSCRWSEERRRAVPQPSPFTTSFQRGRAVRARGCGARSASPTPNFTVWSASAGLPDLRGGVRHCRITVEDDRIVRASEGVTPTEPRLLGYTCPQRTGGCPSSTTSPTASTTPCCMEPEPRGIHVSMTSEARSAPPSKSTVRTQWGSTSAPGWPTTSPDGTPPSA